MHANNTASGANQVDLFTVRGLTGIRLREEINDLIDGVFGRSRVFIGSDGEA